MTLRAKQLAFVLLAIGLIAVFHFVCTLPHYQAALYAKHDKQQIQHITLPYTANSTSEKKPLYAIKVPHEKGGATSFHIIVDDCIEGINVNGQSVPIPQNMQKNRCNYNDGITVDLAPAMHAGMNHVIIDTSDSGGLRALTMVPVVPVLSHVPAAVPLLIATACILMLAYARRRDFDTVTWGAIFIALLVELYHYQLTTYSTYSHDLSLHIQYIYAIASDGWRWNIFVSSIFRHPPGYYLLTGFIYALALKFGAASPIMYARALSPVFFAIFAYFSIRALQLLLEGERRRYYWLALAIFLCWPHNYAVFGVINDDISEYAFHMAATYWLLRWVRERSADALWKVLLYIALAFLMKNSALILGFAALCVIVYYWKSLSLPILASRRFIAVYILALAVFSVGIGYNFVYAQLHGELNQPLLAGRIGPPVDVSGVNAYLPDFYSYFHTPFVEYGPPDSTLNNFPNIFIKSMLFGEYTWGSATLALWLLPLHLLVVMLALLYLFSMSCETARRELVSIAMVITAVAAVIAFRSTYHIAANQDFRYCYAILPLLVAWSVKGVRRLAGKDLAVLTACAWLACIGFAVLSAAFIIGQCLT